MTRVKSGSRRRTARPGAELHDNAGQDHPAQDWSAVAVGSTVTVVAPAGPPYLGRVDAGATFGVLLTAGVLWAAGPLLHPAGAGGAGETGHAVVVGFTIYS